MSYLAVDPGDTTGLALIGNSGELLWEGMCKYEDLAWTLTSKVPHSSSVSAVIVEDFALIPHKSRAVSQKKSRHMKAARGIGVCEMYAWENGIEMVFRDPRHWRTGLMLAGIPQEEWIKDHSKGHAQVAYGLGFHWLVEEGLVTARMPGI